MKFASQVILANLTSLYAVGVKLHCDLSQLHFCPCKNFTDVSRETVYTRSEESGVRSEELRGSYASEHCKLSHHLNFAKPWRLPSGICIVSRETLAYTTLELFSTFFDKSVAFCTNVKHIVFILLLFTTNFLYAIIQPYREKEPHPSNGT